jgi:hypothetical protein
MLNIVTYFWGNKYDRSYVTKLKSGLARHVKEPYRFIVMTDKMTEPEDRPIPAADLPLTKIQGCLARLRLFDPEWQFLREIGSNDRIVSMDLDCIITGELDALFLKPEPFLILKGANSVNPCPFNGSIWMLRAGYRPDVWTDFSLDTAPKNYLGWPDDQDWFAQKMPDAAGWEAGPRSGVYAFGKPGWPKGTDLPKDTRLVAFPGSRDPSMFTSLGWVQQHWQ